jgi:uroporphyrinogen III methyltransferase/synthase
MLENDGAFVIAFPTIRIDAVKDLSLIEEKLKSISQYNYIIFTSVNSVEYFVKSMKSLNLELPLLPKVVAVGEKTKSYCVEAGIRVDSVPSEYSGTGVIKMLQSEIGENSKIFIPASNMSRNELPDGLRKLGAIVDVVTLYINSAISVNEHKEEIDSLFKKKPDAFLFTSPSSFKSFLKILKPANEKDYFSDTIIASIGNSTKEEIQSFGLTSQVVPRVSTLEFTVKELIKYYSTEVRSLN